MADPNVVNIKGLPRVEEIAEGNLLIVENEQGTNTLDFVNFVIGPNNTSFYNEIKLGVSARRQPLPKPGSEIFLLVAFQSLHPIS